MILGLGVEIGWKGFLQKNIKANFFKKNILIGSIWGIWHIPIILNGHNYHSHAVIGIGVQILLCIVLIFYLSIALKKQTVSLLSEHFMEVSTQ